MPTIRDAINKELDTRDLAIAGQQTIEVLRLDETRGKEMYFKGPPEMVYCKLPDGTSVRVALIDSGILSNEMLGDPEGFRVKVAGPYYKLPRATDTAVAYGELVRSIPKDTEKDIGPTVPAPLLGHPTSSTIVKSMEIAGTSVKVGEGGDIELKCQGEAVRSMNKDVEIKRKPENSTVMFGGDKKTIFKESFLGQILPKSFIPPMSTPNWLPDMSILGKANNLLSNAMELVGKLKVDL
jgi:hypothetical protein